MLAFSAFFMSFLYVLLHILAFSCELLFFYIPPTHFLLFFSLFYTSMLFLLLYISHALSYFLSFIYAIVSVIFYMRKRPLRLRLLFLRVQHYFCFLLLLPFLILPKLRFCFLLFLLFFFQLKGFISSFISFLLFSRKGDLCFVCCFSAFSSISALFSYFFFSLFTKAPLLLSLFSSFSPFG